ncbi:MAG: serine/threonine protein kinase [Micromonosporaceae bacterium]|nr:serine/threonine protein kinase [Micromonosporaceae bacterium]
MGRVWLAHDVKLDRRVAVKEIIPPQGLSDRERTEIRLRTLREARTAASLSHPNVVRVFDTMNIDDQPWIVMEYVLSRSLQEVIDADGPMSPFRAADIGLAVLAALRTAHKAGVLHRDVKPGNVLLADDGRVVLTDFGLATFDGDPQVTRTGMILGSPQYIAPERASQGLSLPESDLWSFGATLYAAVEGRAPYARANAMATLTALMTEEPDAAPHAGPLAPALEALLRKDPARRPSAETVERLLRRVIARSPADARAALRAPTAARPMVVITPKLQRPAATDQAQAQIQAQLQARQSAGNHPTIPAQTSRSAAEHLPASGPGGVGAAGRAGGAGTASGAGGIGAPAGTGGERRAAEVQPASGIPPAEGQAAAPAAEDQTMIVNVDGTPPTRFGRTKESTTIAESLPHPASEWYRHRAVRYAAAGLAVAALLAFLATVVDSSGDDHRSPGATGTSASQAAASGSVGSQTGGSSPSPSPTAFTLPSGWVMHVDSTGFQVAIPQGWSWYRSGSIVRFKDPQGGRELAIDQTDHPKADPVADWTNQESQRRYRMRSYQRVKIEKVEGFFLAAADWEYTYANGSGTPLHVNNRGFVTGQDHAYAIFWLTIESKWQENLDTLAIITASFRPAT